jgi:hypothetical protein
MDRRDRDNAEPPDPLADEQRLRAIFDASIEPAPGPTLTKLLARAADVPERARRTPLWLPRWAWKPTAAGLVVAGGALSAAFIGGVPFGRIEPAPAASAGPGGARTGSDVPEMAAAVAPDVDATAPAAPPSDLEMDMDIGGLAGADVDWDIEARTDEADDALDALYGPPADANLDAWLYATHAMLEGGG